MSELDVLELWERLEKHFILERFCSQQNSTRGIRKG
jgi:hypothetical protein